MKPTLSAQWYTYRAWLSVLGLAVLFVVGLGMRRAVLEAQQLHLGYDLPFTLESALHFQRIEKVYEEGELPRHDPAINYPEGIDVFKTYSVGTEFLYASLAHLFPQGWTLQDRIRWLEVAAFCLGIPILALGIGWWMRSATAGWVAGFSYATSLASIIRSTGQELSRENTALPLIVAHLVLWLASLSVEQPKGRRTLSLVTALVMGLAWLAWDMTQFYIVLWMAVQGWSWFFGGEAGRPRIRKSITMHLLVLLLVGFAHPYLRSHAFFLSPGLLLGGGLLFADRANAWWGLTRTRTGVAFLALLAVLPVLWLPQLAGGWGGHYGHFGELLWAKLQFLNVKPEDPGLLSFAARIMWVPALHSATWPLAYMLFPATVPLTFIGVSVLLRRPGKVLCPGLYQFIFFYTASLLTFFLFVRFHVFLAIFSAGLLGVLATWGIRRKGWVRWWVIGLVTTALVVETGHVLRHRTQWGRVGVYYEEIQELTDWLHQHAKGEPVLANFGVSASILANTGCPIVLHPKFESKEIRERVRAYGEMLFTQPESAFRTWANQFDIHYYVYALGEFAEVEPRYQMRYFVNALEPPKDAAARVFEERPNQANYFEYVWGNRKYRVFKIYSRNDEEKADGLTEKAETAFQKGDLDQAETLAMKALSNYPHQSRALKIVDHVQSLRALGFKEPPNHQDEVE